MIPRDATAAIIGAAGGLGAAFATSLANAGFAQVAPFSRHPPHTPLDLEDEASIAAAAATLDGPPLRLILVATGLLHAPGLQPEKTYRALDASALATLFRINTIGPALVAKHFLPHLARTGPAIFAVLSARVGSISDNRLGGWHGYRASKAALNMIVRNLAIELARTRPDQICVGLHPGTVATPLSAPFRAGATLLTPADSAARLLDLLDRLEPANSGRCYAYSGAEIPA
jgi:NAD(P)-dependent dehydrogenase (short-subunit alcohol dehydrogenase family)